MQAEVMKILQLIEDGKINADEASRLITDIKDVAAKPCPDKEFEKKLHDFTKSVQSFAKDVSDKTAEICKAVTPKVKDATKVVVTKTAEVVDNISKTLNEAVKNMDKADCGDCEEETCKEDDCGKDAECSEENMEN